MGNIKRMYISLFSKLGIAFVMFSLFRILFILFNYEYFNGIDLWVFIGGFRFDWMSISILFLPFIIVHFIDFKGQSNILALLFHTANVTAILFNAMDLEYFKFTLKRTTSDLFLTQGLAHDLSNLAGSFLIDFWYVVVIALAAIWISIKAYNKTKSLAIEWPGWKAYLGFVIPVLLFVGLGVRGGVQLKPLGVISAAEYTNTANIPIVLNTPFTILKSAFKEGIAPIHYYSEEELNTLYSPVHSYQSSAEKPKLNVVLIIAESFSKEYIGAFNESGYTPYLDTLIGKSLVFDNAFANGKKSIEALPAILSGIPSWMNTPYISGKYGSNKISSIGNELAKQGYETSFYHGGQNGTMGFESFTQIAGIETYKGLIEYPNEGDFDGVWGIFDRPYLQYILTEIDAMSKPFFTTIFTLSSHHPYTIEPGYEDQFEGGPLPILKSIEYADFAIHDFLKVAESKPWFDETIFVITADHTAQALSTEAKSRTGMFRIPIIIYAPKYIEPKLDSRVAQQTDLYPTLMELLQIETDILSYGESLFNDEAPRYSVNFLRDIYQIMGPKYVLTFDGNQALGIFDYTLDPLLENNLIGTGIPEEQELESALKARIQSFNNRMIQNQFTQTD